MGTTDFCATSASTCSCDFVGFGAAVAVVSGEAVGASFEETPDALFDAPFTAFFVAFSASLIFFAAVSRASSAEPRAFFAFLAPSALASVFTPLRASATASRAESSAAVAAFWSFFVLATGPPRIGCGVVVSLALIEWSDSQLGGASQRTVGGSTIRRARRAGPRR